MPDPNLQPREFDIAQLAATVAGGLCPTRISPGPGFDGYCVLEMSGERRDGVVDDIADLSVTIALRIAEETRDRMRDAK